MPADPRVSISSKTITVTVATPRGVGCLLATTQWEHAVRVGPLDPGSYTVRILLNTPRGVSTIAERDLVIIEAEPSFRIYPPAAPVGSRPVLYMEARRFGDPLANCGATQCTAPEVKFGSVAAESVHAHFSYGLNVVPPQLPPGTYDVTISRTENERRVVAAFRVYDPTQPPDESLFETILIPVTYNGRGVFGSEWRTEVAVRNPGAFLHLARETSFIEPYATIGLKNPPNDDRGFLFHPLRHSTTVLSYAAFVRDVSREAERWGTELPVVRETDFRRQRTIDFPVVPLDGRYRTTLRIYALDVQSATFGVVILDELGKAITTKFIEANALEDGRPAFAVIPDLLSIARLGRVSVSVSGTQSTRFARFWAFITVSNNDTQHVTVISPQ